MRDDIMKMAFDAGMIVYEDGSTDCHYDELERFFDMAKTHALANIDPSSFMSYQEGYDAGQAAEREACAKVCDEFCYGSTKILVEKAIRARGQE